MNILNKFFSSLTKGTSNSDGTEGEEVDVFTAKEKQSIFVKTYLKPALKTHRYLANAQTWWRDEGDFFIIINLQNFSWNTKNSINFCFNIGVALKSQMKDRAKKPTYSDLTIPIREGAYLPDPRETTIHRSKVGYIINQDTDINDFIKEAKIDFEDGILLTLDNLKTIDDCINFYKKFPFWGDRLKELTN